MSSPRAKKLDRALPRGKRKLKNDYRFGSRSKRRPVKRSVVPSMVAFPGLLAPKQPTVLQDTYQKKILGPETEEEQADDPPSLEDSPRSDRRSFASSRRSNPRKSNPRKSSPRKSSPRKSSPRKSVPLKSLQNENPKSSDPSSESPRKSGPCNFCIEHDHRYSQENTPLSVTCSCPRESSPDRSASGEESKTEKALGKAGESTSSRPFKCKCGRAFVLQSDLAKHIHDKEKIHVCDICEKTFSELSNLTRHKFLHTGERPFMCEKCGKRFSQNGALVKHQQTHYESRPYKCQCGAAFRTKYHLSRHRLIESGQVSTPYSCSQCDKNFTTSSNLKQHVLRHSGEKPFKCDCGKAFATKAHLNLHRRIHTGEKRYKCDCGKSFTFHAGFAIHKRVHTGEKPYTCDVCSESFAALSNMKRHKKLKHMKGKSNENSPMKDKSSVIVLKREKSSETVTVKKKSSEVVPMKGKSSETPTVKKKSSEVVSKKEKAFEEVQIKEEVLDKVSMTEETSGDN